MVDSIKFKYRPAALRGLIYGKGSAAGHLPVGIEIRDPTRNMGTWEQIVKKFHSGISQKVWERAGLHHETIHLSVFRKQAEREVLAGAGLSPPFIQMVDMTEPTFAIPLQRYESAKFTDFRNDSVRAANAEQAKRIIAARDRYLEALKKLEQEYNDIRARGESVDNGDIKSAVRMTMSEWARDARVSELFGGI